MRCTQTTGRMKTPLRIARESRNLTLVEVARVVNIDAGNLSRIERGAQTPSLPVAERLVAFFAPVLTEVQVLYPSRFIVEQQEAQSAS